MTYAFSFDASACSGCKACQEACKDKNGLPVGILWRRVIEVSGGEWQAHGSAWENSVFAYNLSVACNHCTHPKCAGVCPTDAYQVRPDGIVLLDATKCMGCGYCTWACPYAAPQYDIQSGVMTKCDFCADRLDAGLPPSCVAACPLRVLNYCQLEDMEMMKGGQRLWQLPGTEHPFPLPAFSRTEPHLVVKPHLAMQTTLDKSVANAEEIWPPGSSEHQRGLVAAHELPLVAFTLLAQMAAGLALGGLVTPLSMPAMLSIGMLLGLGGLISFLHLGRKRNAWRAVVHIRKSWLSREVLMAGLFAIAWAVTAGWQVWQGSPTTPWPMAILGIGLVYSMSRVYRLRAVPSWNTWRTQAAFFLSTITLGSLGLHLFQLQARWIYIGAFGLVCELAITLSVQPPPHKIAGWLRVIFFGLSLLGALLVIVLPSVTGIWMAGWVLTFALAGEVTGRWLFYASRAPFPYQAG